MTFDMIDIQETLDPRRCDSDHAYDWEEEFASACHAYALKMK